MGRPPVIANPAPTFSRWLRQQRYREGRVGDLARFAAHCKVDVDDIGIVELRARLRWQQAPPGLKTALHDAAREWSKSTARNL